MYIDIKKVGVGLLGTISHMIQAMYVKTSCSKGRGNDTNYRKVF
jgi:hypothetical protein